MSYDCIAVSSGVTGNRKNVNESFYKRYENKNNLLTFY